MPLDEKKVDTLRVAYSHLTGDPCNDFFCPILMEHGVGGRGLMEGHILPDSIKTAARATVVQRADVDNFFGQTIEPDLITFINSPLYEISEFLKRARDLMVTGASGLPAPAFVASPKSSPKLPKIGLVDKTGEVVASPHVRTTLDELGGYSGSLLVEGTISVSHPAILGSMLKAAHLTLWEIFGYAWVLSPAGRRTGEALSSFWRDRADKSNCDKYFMPFNGCFNLIYGNNLPWDTLSNRLLLIHLDLPSEQEVHPSELPQLLARVFAASCVFKMNNATFLVTVPFCMQDDSFDRSLPKYREFLQDRHMAQKVYPMEVPRIGEISFSDKPLPLRYSDDPKNEK